MGRSGINKTRLEGYGGKVYCFMSDEDVALAAKEKGTTRAVASMEKACALEERLIFAIGNAPTALIRLYELIREGKIRPELVIAVPVGFVNVVQSKELIRSLEDTPYIVARGRKGRKQYCRLYLQCIDLYAGQILTLALAYAGQEHLL